MVEAILFLEILTLAVLFYFTRRWEVLLHSGKNVPDGRIPLYLRFFRVQHWIIFFPLLVFAAHPAVHPSLLLVFPAVFSHQAFLFAINDYRDREVDSQNPFKSRRNVIASGELSTGEAKMLLAVLVGVSLLLPVFLGLAAVFLSVIFLVASYAYSSPPWRLKGRVAWDLVSHAFLVFSYPFAFTSVAFGIASIRNAVMYGIFLLLSVYIQISQETRDLSDDSRFETNSVVRMGHKRAYVFMFALFSLSFALSFWLILTNRASCLFLLVPTLCGFGLYDLYLSWRSQNLAACYQNTWLKSNRKILVAFTPVLLWWWIHS